MIAFFLRRENDIDHMVPIIYKMASQGEKRVKVYTLDPLYDISRDPRLNYLKENWNLQVESIYGAYLPTFWHRLIKKLMCFPIRKRNFLTRAYSFFVQPYFYKLGQQKFFNGAWAKNLIQKFRFQTFVFDYAKPNQFIVGALLEGARYHQVKTVSVPHGLKIWSPDEMETRDSLLFKGEDRLLFDSFIICNDLSKQFYVSHKKGMDASKIRICGSSRYAPEWMEQCQKIYSEKISFGESEKINVVFFEGGAPFLKDQLLLKQALQFLEELNFINLIIRRRSRSRRVKLKGFNRKVLIDYETPTPRLVDWADVVIVGVTSVFMEAFYKSKTLIYFDYLHSAKTVLEEEEAGWIIKDFKELKEAFEKIRDDKGYRPYTEESVKRLISRLVFNGNPNRDVLDGYCQLILGREKEKISKAV